MKIIAGLGNPGSRYSGTRHNAGWMGLERLQRKCDARSERFRGKGSLARGEDLLLFKPLGYMNRSGPPIARLLDREGASPADLLVLVDDVNLPLGTLRLRAGGSSGGHNGLASVRQALGTQEFARLRMGVGPCPPGVNLVDFVLSPFHKSEWETVRQMAEKAADAALCWADEGVEPTMNRFNGPLENGAVS
ncbi:MAG: aminoacyl-tRNA hydrolase [Candidatus Brocadiia bacterium]